ncbi:MAG: hypothetical protein RL701_451, partial [Pseudomonadota bacterium]
ATVRRRHMWSHYAYGMSYGHHHGHYGFPPWAHGLQRRRRQTSRKSYWVHALFEQLDTTPGQEKAILKSMETFTEQMAHGRGELVAVRKQVAQALGGDELDESVLSAALEKVEDLIVKTKLELTQTLTEIHASLDGQQRKLLAELIADGLTPRNFGFERF